MQYKGHGIQVNVISANDWFAKSAAQGHPQALTMLEDSVKDENALEIQNIFHLYKLDDK